MISRELVKNIIQFKGSDRYAYDFPERYGSDFILDIKDHNNPDNMLANGIDEWGCRWEALGKTHYGEVKNLLLKDWKDFDKIKIPEISDPKRWERIKGMRERAGDKFLIVHGMSLYERFYYLRGQENAWMDLYDEPDNVKDLINILVEMNLFAVQKYREINADGYIIGDDWGTQNQLMISPQKWKEFWKPAYARVFKACHDAGMVTMLHSCGYIVEILDDLIEIGLDVIHMDQQENMGLELLGKRFSGRLTFFSPVDIQNTFINGSMDEIRAYCRKMAEHLGNPKGGFIPRWYADPIGVGHRLEAIDVMCEEFLKISKEKYGKC